MKRRDLLLRVAFYGLLLLASAATLGRQLSVGESAAVRAGWLVVTFEAARPVFYTPFTLGLGQLALRFRDPGTFFLTLRALALATVFAALAWATFRTRLPAAEKLGALILVLANGAFVAHGFGFGMGWPVVVGTAVAFGLLQRPGRWAWLGIGACVAWLLVHHVAGVVFGAVLYLAALAVLLTRPVEPDDRKKKVETVAGFHVGLVAGLAVWAALSRLLGQFEAWSGVGPEVLRTLTSEVRVSPWTALGPLLRRDAVWLALAGIALVAVVVSMARRRGIDPGLRWAVVFAVTGIGLCLVHPYPPDWMAALPVPFLALPAAHVLARVVRGWTGRWGVAKWLASAAGLAVLQFVAGPPPGWVFVQGLASPMTAQVETLREAVRYADPFDKALDPTGLLYFLPPAQPRWYLDGLYAEDLRRTGAAAETGLTVENGPGVWLLVSPALDDLPIEGLRREFVHVGGGLALSRQDPRVARDRLRIRLDHETVRFFR